MRKQASGSIEDGRAVKLIQKEEFFIRARTLDAGIMEHFMLSEIRRNFSSPGRDTYSHSAVHNSMQYNRHRNTTAAKAESSTHAAQTISPLLNHY